MVHRPRAVTPPVLLAALVLAACRGPEPPPVKPGMEGPYEVSRFVDGDTIRLADGERGLKVRLVCVDTPETRGERASPLGRKATSALEGIVGRSRVYLRAAEGHEDRDRYGRLLRHVFLEDETHVNLELVRSGWSAYYTKHGPCSRYHALFLEAEHGASTDGRGIWAHPDFLASGYLDNARGGERR